MLAKLTSLIALVSLGIAVNATTARAADNTDSTAGKVSITPTAEQISDPEWIQSGRKKFVKACAYCHGQEGDSGKNKAFRERIDWDPNQIHDVIANGRQSGSNVMPAWKDSIDDELIWNMVAYIRSLSGKPR